MNRGWIPMLILLIFKAFRSGGLIMGNFFLTQLSFSLINTVFFLLLLATPIALLISRPKFPEFWKRKWSVLFHSFLYLANILLWCVGLKYFGPIK